MNFIDEAYLEVRAGDGGSGASSFRREKYIPFGGPDGGDGGKGGNIFFKVNQNTNTLIDFQNKKIFEAKNGQKGSGKNKSTNINNKPVLEICFKNFIPKPAPSDAPSINPGISAIT